MRTNPERRTALTDAAVDVLADEGARGLTFRAVDTRAQVPAGTTSNYFRTRDELLVAVGAHVFTRLAPDPATVHSALSHRRDHALLGQFLRDIVDRATADQAAHLALLELRLESTRKPALAATFTATMVDALRANVAFHLDAGLPGDEESVELLYATTTGLIIEHLTLPEFFSRARVDRLIARLVSTME
ncbi:TetR/AcrR family transcriptional regulator [Actinokineospora sp. NBRC 105648]|uniref:TetR/AcrR family transcriptional regulator n=1 Tax=Actinokineospora sp. NBRC 105648 TaxID=3032206 RepID=UPI0024A1BC04|nr:TetR/AcrR family transcriptional regulator [Actinokineospora sp. NBRC 105648]GLZ43375.1 TetR family transcriptional regulator [Actinokineospora sp. NBRC 105648]